jgi:hypothetical protein
MITVTFDNKLTEQFENYGEVLKWVNDELAATSLSEYSDPRVKLELLTKEEIQFLANDDHDGIWANVIAEYNHFDYAVFNLDNDHKFVGAILNINSLTYTDVLSFLDDCGILYLFNISED